MRHDLLSDVLSGIKNGDKNGKREAITPFSKLIKDVLLILQKQNYIGDFEKIDDKKGGRVKIQLLGKINDCNSIKPRFYVKKDGYDKWEKRYLPAISLGFLILSTPQGIMTHDVAKEKGIGGTLLAFIY
ncbi:30S ribosomal protein S8 [Candidatus Micrarchaeota archaeon RBG_16_36_9]|nr:small subunit ribosomal protein S8 [uncultured archaeon]OGI11944.1 MAG: 30S ribosomal protein S8 [Candidatus Micrarchaeota archaeon RBG_16_36_9]